MLRRRVSLIRTLSRSLSGILVGSLIGLTSCKSESTDSNHSPEKAAAPLDIALSRETKNVLYTWVDQEGSFHITEQAAEIPAASRKMVRVVVDGKAPGTADRVFVADLSNLEGNFPVSSMGRPEWEALGKAAREKKIAELRPPEEPQAPSPADLGVDAIVYGADWCKPCHLAEDYLKKKGARVVKKDIEEDPQAASEMKQKLKTAGLSGSSIPVLDVGGTILRGFSAPSIDRALQIAKK